MCVFDTLLLSCREDERIDEQRAEEEGAGKKLPPKKEYPAGEEPYDADDLMEILEVCRHCMHGASFERRREGLYARSLLVADL